jgi:hypothetical protein
MAMAGKQMETAWLEEGRDMAECSLCYDAQLVYCKECPTCFHPTDTEAYCRVLGEYVH